MQPQDFPPASDFESEDWKYYNQWITDLLDDVLNGKRDEFDQWVKELLDSTPNFNDGRNKTAVISTGIIKRLQR